MVIRALIKDQEKEFLRIVKFLKKAEAGRSVQCHKQSKDLLLEVQGINWR